MMLRVTPFEALRPADDLVSIVATPAQMAAGSDEIAPLLKEDPFHILHVLRPEIDLPSGATRREVLTQAADAFSVFCGHEILMQDQVPCVYLYQLRKGERIYTAIVLGCPFENVDRGMLKAGPRAAAMNRESVAAWEELQGTVGAQFRPVSIVYPDSAALDALVEEVLLVAPLGEVTTTEDGVTHRLWAVPGEALTAFFESAFAALPGGTVVDGFEELEALLRLRQARLQRGEVPPPFFMAAFFPASQMGTGMEGNGSGNRVLLRPCAGLLTLAFPAPMPVS